MTLTIREPGSALTHFFTMMAAFPAATILLVKASASSRTSLLAMLLARFLPIIGTLAIAGSLAEKKKIAITAGTLSTTNAMFVFLLIFIILLIGALSFFPALALGPIAEYFQRMQRFYFCTKLPAFFRCRRIDQIIICFI